MNATAMKYSCVFLMVWIAILSQGESLDPEKTKRESCSSGILGLAYLNTLEQAILHILQTIMIPIGFTYVQLPREKSPREIWPMITWKEVSSEYAGVFFRVEGGRSSAFGTVQKSGLPRITRIQSYNLTNWSDGGIVDGTVNLNEFGWSEVVYTGDHTKAHKSHYGLKFYFSQEEIKPINMAIRVWRRTE